MKYNTNLIILDSNFILLPIQFKIDYFSEIRSILEGQLRFIVFQQILDELNSKRKREPKGNKFIRLLESGLEFLKKSKEKYNIEIMEEVKKDIEKTDEFLIRMSVKLQNLGHNVYLATNDSELRRKAKQLNIGVIFLRQKKYLSVERA
ncbi:MAG: PIN domain-containing protein [Candidatus Hodarchaeota archaeon]